MKIWVLLIPLVILNACTLSIGGPNRLPDLPAPTAIPLSEGAESVLGAPEKEITLPSGFGISIFAEGLNKPRMMTIGPDGQLYVAERGRGRIVRLPDDDENGFADRIEAVVAGLPIIEYAPQHRISTELKKSWTTIEDQL